MMPKIHQSSNRGHVRTGWLSTYHSFSFGSWQNSQYMGVSALRVINEDTVEPHTGFGRHGHANMEILTYVLSGQLTHTDSMGNTGVINAGQWQLMSAGTGIEHSEVNNANDPVHLFQIWIYPDKNSVIPSYDQKDLNPHNAPNIWHWVVGDATMMDTIRAATSELRPAMYMHQHADVRVATITEGNLLALVKSRPIAYLHVISGKIEVADCTLSTGDAIVLQTNAQLQAIDYAHVLWFELEQGDILI